MSVNEETKTITIRWHGIRPYKKDEIVGLRGYPENDGTQRYEIGFNGSEWEGMYFAGNRDTTGLGYDPIIHMIKRYKDLYEVIKYCEEHAYQLWYQEQPGFDPQWEYVQQFQAPSEKPDTYNENWDLDDDETGHSNIAASGHGSGFPSDDERLTERHERMENTRNALWENGDE